MGEPKGPGQFSPRKEYSDTPKELHTQEVVLDMLKKLTKKYKVEINKLTSLRYSELPKIIEKFGGVDNLKGKRILDIGCGATSADKNTSRTIEPWLCRALQELGANPVGVDIRDLSKEEFEHLQLDLSEPGALNVFPDKSFDGINCNSFFDFTTFMLERYIRLGIIKKDNIDEEKRKIEDEIKLQKMEISKQIKRLLKDNGKLLIIQDVLQRDLKPELGL